MTTEREKLLNSHTHKVKNSPRGITTYSLDELTETKWITIQMGQRPYPL